MKPKHILIIFAVLLARAGYAQNTYNHKVFWGRITLADTINNKLKWEVYLQTRTQDAGTGNMFATNHYYSVFPWLNYAISKSTRISLSPVAYFNSHPFYNDLSDVKDHGTKEYRVAIKIENDHKWHLFNFANRYSLEYRMRDLKHNGNYLANWRIRYQLRLEKPLLHVLSDHKPVSVFVADEVMVQFGEAVKNNPNAFDQNRINIGLTYEVVKNIKMTASYLNIYQSHSSDNGFDNANALWMMVTFDNLFSQFKKHQIKG